ncbi:MAG: FAD-dependent monooxygenase [Kofleriaceae bacterium]|nr:FAD-dependent monooxygenase [Kofleriaceae bacterium]
MSAKPRTALIIGCGIGGPVAAIALRRAGFEPVVYEAYDRSATHVGSFLNLASNGLDALKTLGVADAVTRAGFATPRMVMWSGTGKQLGEVANGETLPDGTTSITIKRGLLHRALRDEVARLGIRVEEGKRFVDCEEGVHGVLARFEDGSEVTGGILVGADGVHSRVRQKLDPRAPKPSYTRQLSIGGVARLTLPAKPGTYHMTFGKRAFFAYAISPAGEVYWFANVASETDREALAMEAWKARLHDLLEGDAGPALDILDATGDEIAVYPIYDMPTVHTWHRGRAVLLGDAIHATSPSAGQGASLAIEDALVLAKSLRDTDDIAEAFARYENARRARVERVVRYSNRIGGTKIAGPVGRWFRDLLMPAALKLFASGKSHAWLYRHHIDWEQAA